MLIGPGMHDAIGKRPDPLASLEVLDWVLQGEDTMLGLDLIAEIRDRFELV
jgi:hypothetical protein